jgi:hypothetical protein
VEVRLEEPEGLQGQRQAASGGQLPAERR